jgi:hypothetical protein
MLSNLQIAFALGGKVHGRGALCPAPGRWADDFSLSIEPNAAGDDYIIDPAACRSYVEEKLARAIAASRPATPPRPRPSPSSPPINFFDRFMKLRIEAAVSLVPLNSEPASIKPNWIEKALESNAPTPPPPSSPPLAPDITTINKMLYALFPPAFAHVNPGAGIEIAFGNPKTGNAVNQAEIFSVFELEKAATFAARKNADGNNTYIAPALRIESHKQGRATGKDVLSACFAWCEYDKADDAERVTKLCKENLLWPAMIVTTGTIPDRREQLYFAVEGTPTPQDLTDMGASLKELFSTDSVHNCDRVMRLAGSINWPTPAKISRGYHAELTTLRLVPEFCPYSIEKLRGLGQPAGTDEPNVFEQAGEGYAEHKPGRSDVEILKLLEATRGAKDWHNAMLRAVASMLGYDWSDLQIRLACAPYCINGVNDKDLDPMINDARVKWGKPDPGTPEGKEQIQQAKQIGPHIAILATPYAWTDPAKIPLRDWLYGRLLVRQFLSMTIAPGGVGKSSLVVGEVLAMVTGRNLLGVKPGVPLKVWLWNLEDPQVETARKIQAACIEHEIKREEIEGRLFVNSGRDQPLVIAKTLRTGAVIIHPVIDDLVRQIKEWEIDVLIIDPFVSCHEVEENDNSAIDMVAKQWSRVAELGDCAVHIVHHTRKAPAGTEVTTESGRGAKALSDAARIARALNRMSDDEAAKAGVDNPRSHFRAINDKANLAPPTSASDWFRLAGVPLGNGPFGVGGDEVGVIVKWSWPDHTAGVTGNDFDRVAAVIRGGKWRSSPQAGQWVGHAVARGLGLDIGDKRDKAKVSSLIKYWISTGALVEAQADDEKRMPRMFVEVKAEQ